MRNPNRYRTLLLVAALTALPSTVLAKLDAEALCERERVRQIGKYGRCRMEAKREARAAGTSASFEACDAAFATYGIRDCSRAEDQTEGSIRETSGKALR